MVTGTVGRARSDGTSVGVPTARLSAALRPLRPRGPLIAVLTVLYAVLCVAVLSGSAVVDLDSAALRWASDSYQPGVFWFLWQWVLLGQRAVLLGVAVAWLGVRAVRHRDVRPLISLGVVTLLLNVTVGLVKNLIGRVGPLQLGPDAVMPGASHLFADGTIFPSGHTANAVVTWGLLAMLARRRRRLWVLLAVFLSVTIGLSTIYLRTHWVSDVLAGWAAGALVLLAVPALSPVVDLLERAWVRLVDRFRGRARTAVAVPPPTVAPPALATAPPASARPAAVRPGVAGAPAARMPAWSTPRRTVPARSAPPS